MPTECSKNKKVLVLYTGGTIGMQKDKKGAYVPSLNSFVHQLKRIPELHDEEFAKWHFEETSNALVIPNIHDEQMLAYTVIQYDPLYDSSNMSTADWITIATDIEKYYDHYDGFVILHGTDTLAYTASALSFMLEGLRKPVILTGSQIPIYENRSDAKSNFLSSLIIAACFNINEVCIYFSNKLLRGNRTCKVSSNLLDAFNSPNLNPLANFGINIHLDHYNTYHHNNNNIPEFAVNKKLSSNVIVLFLFPTITGAMLRSFLGPEVEGVVLQSYGVGNIPSNRNDVLEVLKEAIERGIIIVNITQCSQGTVFSSYATGQILKEIGLISGFDMTTEAAFAKLTYVLGQDHLHLEDKKKLMSVNLRGELTEKH